MIILGVETSCDETAISLIKASDKNIEVLSNVVSSQVALHAAWGGVVPNLAAREHLKNIIPVLEKALQEAQLKKDDIDLIAVTEGPGLIPALLIGTNFAKTLSYLWHKPLLGIHHIEGHIYANFIGDKIHTNSKLKVQNSKLDFPLLALVISGGHTQLVLMKDHLQYQIVGETQDDAAGEAFDKVARILGLSYPGGPAISALADNFKFKILNLKSNPNEQILNNKYAKLKITKNDLQINPDNNTALNAKILHKSASSPCESALKLPRPMFHSKDFNFSFSGLKTAVLYAVKDYRKNNNLTDADNLPEEFIEYLAYEFQEAATDVLVHKTIKTAQKYAPRKVIIAGGVSANQRLNEKMKMAVTASLPATTYQEPNILYSLDNATMIAVAAYYRWSLMSKQKKESSLNAWQNLQTNASLDLQ